MKLYHSTFRIINKQTGFNIKGVCGYGVYLAKNKSYSSKFGDMLYKVEVKPVNTKRFDDQNVRGKGFFNMNKTQYDDYIKSGFDSLSWYRKGILTEFVVLDLKIIKDIEFLGRQN